MRVGKHGTTILVVGAGGQLGRAMTRRNGVRGLTSSELDVTCASQVHACLEEIRPIALVNAAAYTAVDAAEANHERAMRVNCNAVGVLAGACRAVGVRLIHISTDFVFDGTASKPICPSDPVRPISSYGRSKLAGERICSEVLGDQATVVRTAWLYAAGHRNFVSTMLRLMRSRDEIGVVSDQIGTPTWSETLASGVLRLIGARASGFFHLTDAGVASWYDFAVAIEEIGRRQGLLERSCCIRPIRTEDYPTPARRPPYCVLDKTATFEAIGGPTPHWRESLERCLADWTDPS